MMIKTFFQAVDLMKEDLIKAYKRERNRILRMRRKLTNEGYELKTEMPKIPKKITPGSVRRLQKITSRSIQENAVKVDTETGEIVTARQEKVRKARSRGRKQRLKNIREKQRLAEEKDIRRQNLLDQMRQDARDYEESISYQEEDEDILDEWDMLTQNIQDEIDQIPNKSIVYSRKTSPKKMASDLKSIQTNIQNAFDTFLMSVDKDARSKEGAAEIMRQILSDEWLVTQVYDSGDVLRSKYANYMKFADAINSNTLKQQLQEAAEEELTDDENAWVELSQEAMQNVILPEGW